MDNLSTTSWFVICVHLESFIPKLNAVKSIVNLETSFDLSSSDKNYTNQHDAIILNEMLNGTQNQTDKVKKYHYVKINTSSTIAMCCINSFVPYGNGCIMWIAFFNYASGRKYDITIFPPNMNNFSFRVRIYNL